MLKEEDLTYKIRGCIFEVSRVLGAGYLEKVYENALCIELKKAGLNINVQYPLSVQYKGEVVGEYVVDLLVKNRVLIELKAVSKLLPIHEAQILNYLNTTGIKVGLLVNFTHPKAIIKRFVSG